MKHLFFTLGLIAGLAGCNSPSYESDSTDSPDTDGSQGNSGISGDSAKMAQLLTQWTDEVSPNITQSSCIVCHSDSSIAKDSAWVLLANNQDDYLAINLERTLSYIEVSENHAQLLVSKSQGNNHGGGTVVQANSANADRWSQFIELATSESVDTGSGSNESESGSGESNSESRQAAIDFYKDQLADALIQPDCYVCHQANGVAKNSELIFVANNVSGYAEFNANTLIGYAQTSEANLNQVLLKPLGQGHAGGKIIDVSSNHAQNISSFLTLVENISDTPSLNTPETLEASVLLGEVFLVWDMMGNHDSIDVQRRVGTGTWQTVANIDANNNLYRDNNIQQNTTYDYRVRAILGDTQSAYSSVISVTVN